MSAACNTNQSLSPVDKTNIQIDDTAHNNVELHPMYDEFGRLETLPLAWSNEYQFQKSDLCRNGVYFESSSQLYKCAFCAVTINIRVQNITIENYHHQQSPKCPLFTNLTSCSNKPLEKIDNFRYDKQINYRKTMLYYVISFYIAGLNDIGAHHSC
jgi:hypothetical protein